MATISITIPDAQIPRVREALCAYIDLTDPPPTSPMPTPAPPWCGSSRCWYGNTSNEPRPPLP